MARNGLRFWVEDAEAVEAVDQDHPDPLAVLGHQVIDRGQDPITWSAFADGVAGIVIDTELVQRAPARPYPFLPETLAGVIGMSFGS